MAFTLETLGTAAQVTAAINALSPSGHAGQDLQLARAQASAIAEVNSLAPAKTLSVKMEGHREAGLSRIVIAVQAVRAFSGQVTNSP